MGDWSFAHDVHCPTTQLVLTSLRYLSQARPNSCRRFGLRHVAALGERNCCDGWNRVRAKTIAKKGK